MKLCKKKIKDAYPKKVCHMLRHVKKKEENKRCILKEGMPHAHKTCKKMMKREKMHTQKGMPHAHKACQKKEKRKDAYPKKVCHMLQHVKKKRREKR